MGISNSVATQIRLSENLYAEVKAMALETGSSLNSTMLHLMHLGLRIYKDSITLHSQCLNHKEDK